LRFDSEDVRAHAGLAWISALRGHHDQAISEIGTALTLDRAGAHRQLLMKKLNEILAHRDEWSKARSRPD
jgi:hypothetical protein